MLACSSIYKYKKEKQQNLLWSGEFAANSAKFSFKDTNAFASRLAMINLIWLIACVNDLAFPTPMDAVNPTICYVKML